MFLLRVENKQRSRVRIYIWSAHEQGLWKSECDTTPPMARKYKDGWRISLHHSWGVLHSLIRTIKLQRTEQ